jgi:hypothetical protein
LEDFLHPRDSIAYGEHDLPKGSLATDARDFPKVCKGVDLHIILANADW